METGQSEQEESNLKETRKQLKRKEARGEVTESMDCTGLVSY